MREICSNFREVSQGAATGIRATTRVGSSYLDAASSRIDASRLFEKGSAADAYRCSKVPPEDGSDSEGTACRAPTPEGQPQGVAPTRFRKGAARCVLTLILCVAYSLCVPCAFAGAMNRAPTFPNPGTTGRSPLHTFFFAANSYLTSSLPWGNHTPR